MHIVAKPGASKKHVFSPHRTPAFRGRGWTTYLCGACRTELAQNVVPEQMEDLIILCPECGAFNET